MSLKKSKKVEEPAMNEEEKEALEIQAQEILDSSASMERLQLATAIVSNKFGLDDEYSVTKFNDKGKVVDLTLENKEFIISCTIKNSEAQGMYVPTKE